MSETSITVSIPISFCRSDWERENWHLVREQLLDNAKEAARDMIAQGIRDKGWKRTQREKDNA